MKLRIRTVAVAAACITALALIPSGMIASASATVGETTGGVTHTWTNYTNAGGTQGPTIGGQQTVQISCKLQGFRVADGNTWWYQIASSPWNNAYYASADAFYNNGATSGSLAGTPFVDGAVPDCGAVTSTPSVTVSQGPAAPYGYRYAITLNNYAPNAGVSISCRDSVDPGGFYTFTLTTDGSGHAFTQSYCYSGDGPEHWVVAGGVESNHVVWGGSSGGGGSTGGSGTGGGVGAGPVSGGGTTTAPTGIIPCLGGAVKNKVYDGARACAWAESNVFTAERYSPEDCTWFVSQALWAGGLKQTSSWTGSSYNPSILAHKWDIPGPTKDAVNATYFVNYVKSSKMGTVTPISWSDNTAGGAKIGDLIGYYWDKGVKDGTITHLAMVTGFSGKYPTVSQHTPARRDRGWSWNPSANGGKGNWIQYSSDIPNPKAYLIHITK